MKILNILVKILNKAFMPIRLNMAFFGFMYVLGVVCAWVTLPDSRNAKLYDNLYLELFVDVYAACLLLTIIPHKIRVWVKALLYVVLYATAIVDVYCFVKFDSTITPTMLLLVDETDSREAGEFLRSYLSADVLFSNVGWILVLVVVHLFTALRLRFSRVLKFRQKLFLKTWIADFNNKISQYQTYLGTIVVVLFVWGAVTSAHNKAATWKLMTARSIGDVEHTLTEDRHAVLYTPFGRLAFSVYANSLAADQIGKLVAAADKVKVDSCSFRSPTIVLIIGESFSRHHSQQYGYMMPTTPNQVKLEKSGLLVKYSNVVAPWNLTSFVFKNVFSMHVIGQKGEWCDYPLFPELFRKAGYHVTFLTNQFLPKAKEAVYDFSGGFFLNNPKLSAAQFDTRNTTLHTFDDGLLADYDKMIADRVLKVGGKPSDNNHNLVIFHLIGQHVNYRQRSPNDRKRFGASDYDETRPELNGKQKHILADYDNAVLYNDSIVNQICERFENEDAIVIYMPDHGEECYEGTRGFFCRNHSAQVDYDLARYEFDIPFWIYCSHKYAVNHPYVYKDIVQAQRRKFMTDALPHMLLYLAGIKAPDYHAEYNLLSPEYKENRPRILKGAVDYDKLKPKK